MSPLGYSSESSTIIRGVAHLMSLFSTFYTGNQGEVGFALWREPRYYASYLLHLLHTALIDTGVSGLPLF